MFASHTGRGRLVGVGGALDVLPDDAEWLVVPYVGAELGVLARRGMTDVVPSLSGGARIPLAPWIALAAEVRVSRHPSPILRAWEGLAALRVSW